MLKESSGSYIPAELAHISLELENSGLRHTILRKGQFVVVVILSTHTAKHVPLEQPAVHRDYLHDIVGVELNIVLFEAWVRL